MAKRKKQSWWRRHFNFWDILLGTIVLASGVYLYYTQGIEGFYSDFASTFFDVAVVSLVLNFLLRKAQKN